MGINWRQTSIIIMPGFFQAVAANTVLTPGIVTTDLHHHWDAGNASSYPGSGTTWTDLQGNNNLTIFGNPVYNSTSPAHFDLDRVGDYASSVSSWAQPSSANFTVEAWMRMDGQGNYNQMLVTSQDSANRAFILFNNRTFATTGTRKAMVFSCWDSSGNNLGTNYSTQVISLNTWYHVVAVRDGTTSYIYINGTLDTTQSLTNTTWMAGSLIEIGRRNISTVPDYWDGDVSEVRFYSKGLNSTEVAQNWNATKAKYGY